MLNKIVDLLISGSVRVELWIAALVANVGSFTLLTFLDEELFPNLGALLTGLLALAVGVLFVGLFVTWWKLTRALANAKPEEIGGVGPWIGWGIVSALPMFLAVILLTGFDVSNLNWWANSLIFSFAIALMVPMAVLATGRAINREGPSAGYVWRFWKRDYGSLFLAYFLSTAPFSLVSDGLDAISGKTATEAVVAAIASSTVLFASFVLTLAITVVAYREMEASRVVG